MKKFIAIAGVAAVVVIPATANAMVYGTQPGFETAQSNTICSGAGAFGYLGEQGFRHDLGQGDETPAGSVNLGADGPATGLNNSSLCGNR